MDVDQLTLDRLRELTSDTLTLEDAVANTLHNVVAASNGDPEAGARLALLSGTQAAFRASYAAVVAEEAVAAAASRPPAAGAKVLRVAGQPDDGGGKVH